ncbi:MAG: hypothetical protein V3T77_08245 [Planctomycetota bacterium]
MAPEVDLVINCFARTCERVLAPGFFARIEEQNQYPLARRILLINNVEDEAEALCRAASLVSQGEVDAYYLVREHLEAAFEATGLKAKDLGRIPQYSDGSLAAVTLPGSPWLLHWDAEVELQQPVNWIGPALRLMERDPRIMVANPAWSESGLERETIEESGDFALGYGFSDQLYLVRRRELAAPVYQERCPASLRYPLAHIALTFEARVDAYMRTHGRLRATYKKGSYLHPETRHSYPRARFWERWKRRRYRRLIRNLENCTTDDPRYRIWWQE